MQIRPPMFFLYINKINKNKLCNKDCVLRKRLDSSLREIKTHIAGLLGFFMGDQRLGVTSVFFISSQTKTGVELHYYVICLQKLSINSSLVVKKVLQNEKYPKNV